jgi:hypothetical protein
VDLTGGPAPDTLGGAKEGSDPVTHISLSDPLTWVGILVASFLIAGLRWVMRGGRRRD